MRCRKAQLIIHDQMNSATYWEMRQIWQIEALSDDPWKRRINPILHECSGNFHIDIYQVEKMIKIRILNTDKLDD